MDKTEENIQVIAISNEDLFNKSRYSSELVAALDQIIESLSKTIKTRAAYRGMEIHQRENSLHNDALRLLAYRFVNQHGQIPTGRLNINLTTGPIGSGADCEFSWQTEFKECSFSFKFPEPVISNESRVKDFGWDPKLLTPTKISNENSPTDAEYYLGEFDSNEMMGQNYRTAYWLKRIAPNSWEILMLANSNDEYCSDDDDDDDDDENDDPEIISVGVFIEAEVIEYLSDAGVDFDHNILKN
jgi:hypothetical protein